MKIKLICEDVMSKEEKDYKKKIFDIFEDILYFYGECLEVSISENGREFLYKK